MEKVLCALSNTEDAFDSTSHADAPVIGAGGGILSLPQTIN